MSYLAKSIDLLLNQMRNGVGALAGGNVTFYEAGGTTTPKAVYLDSTKVLEAANPYLLSSDGTAELFGDGLYRMVIRSADDTIVYDYDFLQFVASDPSSSVVRFIDASSGNAETAPDAGVYRVTIGKSDSSANTISFEPPAGYTLSVTPNPLNVQGSSVTFVLDGSVYYPI